MNLKKKLKAFVPLARNGNGGFTLVELIVVIAIITILGGVAVPAYSGYVEKANKTADQALVSEVAHALTLYGYSNSGASGYVVLNQEGTPSTADEAGAAAMQAVFGDGWQETAVLKYNGWTDDGLLNYVLANADSAPLIANSTFLTTASPEGLMNAVTNLTDASSLVIQNYMDKYKDDPNKVNDKLNFLLGSEFVTNLNNTGVKSTDPEYTTVISNMLVGEFAGNMNGLSVEDAFGDQLIGMTLGYAELYAYCESINDTTTMAGLNQYLSEATEMDDLSFDALMNYVNNNTTENFRSGFDAFTADETTQGYKDMEAALEIMGAVDHIAGTYTDKESLSDPKLYASESVSLQLDNYINAIKAVANMDTTALSGNANNQVVVFIAVDGSISVVPGVAYLAS